MGGDMAILYVLGVFVTVLKGISGDMGRVAW